MTYIVQKNVRIKFFSEWGWNSYVTSFGLRHRFEPIWQPRNRRESKNHQKDWKQYYRKESKSCRLDYHFVSLNTGFKRCFSLNEKWFQMQIHHPPRPWWLFSIKNLCQEKNISQIFHAKCSRDFNILSFQFPSFKRLLDTCFLSFRFNRYANTQILLCGHRRVESKENWKTSIVKVFLKRNGFLKVELKLRVPFLKRRSRRKRVRPV